MAYGRWTAWDGRHPRKESDSLRVCPNHVFLLLFILLLFLILLLILLLKTEIRALKNRKESKGQLEQKQNNEILDSMAWAPPPQGE